jgi:hypothetical protein
MEKALVVAKGGPVTEAGKAVARLNGVVHGLRAAIPVLPTESQDEWEQHHAGVTDELAPTGAVEMELAERVALLLWRLRRVARYEATVAGASQEDAAEEYVNKQDEKHRYSHVFINYDPDSLRQDLRDYPARIRLLKRFDTMDEGKRVAGEDAGDILRAVGKMAGYHAGDGFDPDTLDYPLPADFDWDEFPDITVAMLRACIRTIATAAKADVAELVAGAIYHYECEVRGARMRLEEAERTIARWRERRALLPVEQLEKVMRYEAHLHRQLVQTLRELEAMQARRRGQAAPLARLDVSGVEQ